MLTSPDQLDDFVSLVEVAVVINFDANVLRSNVKDYHITTVIGDLNQSIKDAVSMKNNRKILDRMIDFINTYNLVNPSNG